MRKVRSVIKLYTEGISKFSIEKRTDLPRNTVKKYIRLFLASGRSSDEIEKKMEDQTLGQVFLYMIRREGLIDGQRYQTLISLFQEIDKKLKRREKSREKLLEQI